MSRVVGMIGTWLGTSWEQALLVVVSTVGIFVGVITYTRIAGLRSFSKMSSFDFAMTVAVGSLMATTAATASASLANGLIALAALYGVQVLVAALRRRAAFGRIVDNRPILLMRGDDVLHENLHRARVTEGDVRAKLREANVLDQSEIRAVVLETTGDVSVLHGDGPLDPSLLDGVRGAEDLSGRS